MVQIPILKSNVPKKTNKRFGIGIDADNIYLINSIDNFLNINKTGVIY
jgi:hypothetical protein